MEVQHDKIKYVGERRMWYKKLLYQESNESLK